MVSFPDEQSFFVLTIPVQDLLALPSYDAWYAVILFHLNLALCLIYRTMFVNQFVKYFASLLHHIQDRC